MLRVFFDDVEIHGNAVQQLTQLNNPFKNNFKAGLTFCRQFDLSIFKNQLCNIGLDSEGLYYTSDENSEGNFELGVDNLGMYYTTDEHVSETFETGVDNIGFFYSVEPIEPEESIPNRVYLYEDDSLYATLLVDSYNDEDLRYITYSLTDMMVQLNKTLYYEDKTVRQILEQICSDHGIMLANQSLYMDDLLVTWGSGEVSERDFVSFVAEVNGSYAYINEQGNLAFEQYSNVSYGSINLEDCSSFKLGNRHLYDRVYVELAEATHYYPETSLNDTLYLNPDNILLTDGENYTIDGIVQHIQSIINGFCFYNVSIEKCPVLDVQVGRMITIGKYQTIAVTDWKYQQGWIGGYEIDVQTSKQEETKILDNSKELIRRISIKVDRNNNEIRQEISDTNGQISRLMQDASSLTGYFANASGAKYIRLTADGIQVSKDNDSSSVNITENGVDIYNDDHIKVASMKANEFDTTNWVYSETRNGNCLNIYKRRV